jgi:hypothetical protein
MATSGKPRVKSSIIGPISAADRFLSFLDYKMTHIGDPDYGEFERVHTLGPDHDFMAQF